MLKEVFVGTQGQQKALACGDIAMDVLEGLFERHELQMQELLADQCVEIRDALRRMRATSSTCRLSPEVEAEPESELPDSKVRFSERVPGSPLETNGLVSEVAIAAVFESHEESNADVAEAIGSKVNRSQSTIQDYMENRKSQKPNVTETYLNLENVKIERKKTGHKVEGFRGKVNDLVQSSLCEYTVAFIIVANAAVFGFQADWAVKHPGQPTLPVYRIMNQAFNIFFIVELTLRIVADGLHFASCWNPDIKWNLMDSALVSLSIFEEIYGQVTIEQGSKLDMTSARVVRLLRLVRVVRIFRVLRFFSDLRIMVMGIMGSFKALAWALLLLFIIIYVTGIIILQFVSEAAGEGWVTMSSSLSYEGTAMFNSLERTCFTLFLCIAGGVSWVEVVNVLEQVNPLLRPILSLYVAFAVFCVLNIVTGVFVERSTSMRLMDEENMMFDELESRKKWLKEIKLLFNEADADGSGQIEWKEFEAVMQDFQAQTALKHLGFDTNRVTTQQLWTLIDYDNSGLIDINEFADALMKLHGAAGAIDIARLRHETSKIFKVLNHVNNGCQAQFSEIKEKLEEVQSKKMRFLDTNNRLLI